MSRRSKPESVSEWLRHVSLNPPLDNWSILRRSMLQSKPCVSIVNQSTFHTVISLTVWISLICVSPPNIFLMLSYYFPFDIQHLFSVSQEVTDALLDWRCEVDNLRFALPALFLLCLSFSLVVVFMPILSIVFQRRLRSVF